MKAISRLNKRHYHIKQINTKHTKNVFNTKQINTKHNLPPRPILGAVSKINFNKTDNVTEEEVLCCLMGSVGFSAKCISKKTGMKEWEIYKTLYKAKIRLFDFRHGDSKWGKMVAGACVNKVLLMK